ncbi:MAG: putative phage abortive infection protein [Bacteroidales bacterium]|nr:putative phage abortive infection protein [Bacteroidales bacterium]
MVKSPSWKTLAVIIGTVGLLIFILIVVWVISDYEIFHIFQKLDLDKASKFGGFVAGIVGVLWTFSGVILIYATFQEQKMLSEKQQFENSFFNMLNVYHNIVNNTKAGDKTGREFYSFVLSKLKDGVICQESLKKLVEGDINNLISDDSTGIQKRITENLQKGCIFRLGLEEKSIFDIENIDKLDSSRNPKQIENIRQNQIIIIYEGIYNNYQSELGYYFRYLFNIFNFVRKERKKYGDDKFYINLIQAQMSNDELGLLFYNGLSKNALTSSGERRFYNWLNDDYNFFQNIDKNSLFHPSHRNYYPNNIIKFL